MLRHLGSPVKARIVALLCLTGASALVGALAARLRAALGRERPQPTEEPR